MAHAAQLACPMTSSLRPARGGWVMTMAKRTVKSATAHLYTAMFELASLFTIG